MRFGGYYVHDPAAVFYDLNGCPAIVNTCMTVPVGGTTYRGTSTFARPLQFPNTLRLHERVVFHINAAFNGTQVLAQSDHLPIGDYLANTAILKIFLSISLTTCHMQ